MAYSSSSSQTSKARKVAPQSLGLDSLVMATQESDLVLVIFIHGFKGTDETFGDFPQRLQHLLLETLEHSTVEVVVFPAYEVRPTLDDFTFGPTSLSALTTDERRISQYILFIGWDPLNSFNERTKPSSVLPIGLPL